jgi:hypothetical protein
LAGEGSISRSGVDVELIDRGAEGENSVTSTHPSSLGGRPYTPSLPDDSSDPDADLDSLRKDSDLLCLKDAADCSGSGSILQLETPESSVTPGADASDD